MKGCAVCAEPYVLMIANADGVTEGAADSCVWKMDKCIRYTTKGVCDKCEYTHYLNSTNFCVPKTHGCKDMILKADAAEYDLSRPRCKTCLNDWFKLEGKCYYGC